MTEGTTRVLVCDDEPHLREMVGEYLAERGYEVTEAGDGEAMLAEMARNPADLVILDIRMPGEDGLSALKKLRAKTEVAVIMLTAAAEVVDRIVGLELGADDYLAKPVDLRELEARVKAVLRRKGLSDTAQGDAPLEDPEGRIAFGKCYLDMESARLYGPDGEEVPLTSMEFSLLKVFVANRGRVLNRDQLLEQAHDRGWEPFDRSIDLRISRIRRKIEVNPAKPETIRTVRGVGYVFG
ncbi:MAG: response regulator [Pseudomonadota bacterium]